MSNISEKTEAAAVREINELYDANPHGTTFTVEFFRDKFPEADPQHLISFLEARKLIGFRSAYLDGTRHYIRLDKCVTYFEDKARQAAEKRSDRRHDWLIAIFSGLAGAFLSKPLWGVLESIWAMFISR